MVRVNITPKHGMTKGHDPKWSFEKYSIIRIDEPTKIRVFIGHELLKGWGGPDVQTLDGRSPCSTRFLAVTKEACTSLYHECYQF